MPQNRQYRLLAALCRLDRSFEKIEKARPVLLREGRRAAGHGAGRPQGRFEVPSVGVTLPVVSDDPDHGARVVRHEIGITYPFADIAARSDAELDFATVSALLDMVRRDLGY